MPATIETLTRFPVKGLSGQTLNSVQLKTGEGFPCDRKFGFARPNSGFDPDNPKPLPKTKFYMLARDAKLALLRTEYDEGSGILSISAPPISEQFDITAPVGQQKASEFIKTYLSLPDDETPQLFEASPHRFTDVSVHSTELMNAVSIINLDSVAAFAAAIGQDVDARRFRGNIELSGLAPFSELDLVGRELLIGSARLKVVKRTRRCPATEVDLASGIRNIKTPKLLQEHYGHTDMGVYAEVLDDGIISSGDTVDLA
ncbi:MAG: MOSC domain-containing protein [Granulosicoccus sp.]|nr:MOSC domain-containing protein [Granulosicoccus sp.]